MDALMAALVAGALAQAGDRTAWLAAILADRFARPGLVILAAALAIGCASLIACAGALLLQGKLTPEAGRLFLALALVLQGAGGLVRAKPPERLAGWRLGAFGTSTVGLFILAFGDGLQFIVLALAARAALPWAAAVGATLGALAVIAPAALLGERGWIALPQLLVRRVAAALFLVTGIVLALSALRLV
ncbi:MAG TPA: TMEM165/GDT1 family protein [Sphingomonas sp.]|uniref:TMEM165/GDT1 family protein n=1 Tax=Sphingomonas sp. TaxID=28214 RepID=UPI002ED90AC0